MGGGCRLEAGIHQVSEVVLLDFGGASHLWGELDGLDMGAGAPRTALKRSPRVFDLIRRVIERAVAAAGDLGVDRTVLSLA